MPSARRRHFGRYHAPDDRDRGYLLRRSESSRTSRLWRAGGQALNQGDTPQCVGYSAFELGRCSPVRQQVASPRALYNLAQEFDEWEGRDYDGTSVRGVAKALQIMGVAESYYWAADVETAVAHVLDLGPLLLGVNWYRNMSYPDSSGRVEAKGRFDGGHAVLLRGADTRSELVCLRNSWGRDYGIGGDCLLSFADLDRLIHEDGEACAIVEAHV